MDNKDNLYDVMNGGYCICNICNKSFKSREEVVEHIELNHTQVVRNN